MEKKEDRRFSRPLLLAGLIFVIILAISAYLVFFDGYSHYTVYEVEKKTERGSVIDTRYFEKEGRLITYNNEGVSSMNEKMEVLWNVGMNLKSPKVEIGGDYIAVASIGGKTISFMNQKSTPVNLVTEELPGAVLDFSISEQGQVAILMNEKKSNIIQILEPFNKNDSLKAEIKTYHKDDGYGMLLALSPDGKKLVTQFVKREGTELNSVLTFYNFGKIGENTNADRIVGIFPYRNTLYGSLSFLTEKDFLAVGDNKILGFSMKHEPTLVFEKGVHGKITKVEADESGFALILSENGQKVVKEADEVGEKEEVIDEEISEKSGDFLLRMNLSGKIIIKEELSMKHTNLAYRNGETLIYSDESCFILNPDGSEKFKANFQENILGMYHTGAKNKYILITGNQLITIKLNP